MFFEMNNLRIHIILFDSSAHENVLGYVRGYEKLSFEKVHAEYSAKTQKTVSAKSLVETEIFETRPEDYIQG